MNSLARTIVKAPNFFYLFSQISALAQECIEYKLLSLTYTVLTTSQPDYLQYTIWSLVIYI